MTNSDITKKGMIQALEKSLGIVSTACNSVGISRQTHYRWLSEDPEYKRDVDDISEIAIDFVESKLHEKIEGVTIGKSVDGGIVTYLTPPSDTAIIFFLKTKAKKRGYIERTEVEQSGGVTIRFEEPEEYKRVYPTQDQGGIGDLDSDQPGI